MMYVKCLKSKKSGKLFYGLFKDLGYKQLLINFDAVVIAEFLGVAVSTLYNLKENEVIEVK